MLSKMLSVTSIFVMLVAVPAKAQPEAPLIAPQISPDGPLTMRSVVEFGQTGTGPMLGGGRVARSSDWPVTFVADFIVDQEPRVCTATLVASRALLTAAHCIGSDGGISFSQRGITYVATCQRPQPGFPMVRSADYALCYVVGERLPDNRVKIDSTPSGPYERINRSRDLMRVGLPLTLTGFGCTRPDLTGRDGLLREGPSRIAVLPGGLPTDPYWMTTPVTLQNGIDVGAGAFICSGDSGGAVYSNEREIVAVNSAQDQYNPRRGISYLSALSTNAAIKYVDDWMNVTGIAICGVRQNATNCRP